MSDELLIFVRTIIAYLLVLVLTRLIDKKQMSQLTFFDYVVGISIGTVAGSVAINPGIELSNGIVALLVLGFIPIIFGRISLKSISFRHLVNGSATTLIKDGKILEDNLRSERLSVDDLMLLLREKKAFNLSDVELAVFETNGKLSVMKKSDKQPITPSTLGVITEEQHMPSVVIMDGKVLERNLAVLGYSKEWLLGEIQKQGAKEFTDVFLAQIDSKGSMYVDLYHEKLSIPQVKQRPLLAAQLKKVQADLESFALQTENDHAREMYTTEATRLKNMLQTLDPYLKE